MLHILHMVFLVYTIIVNIVPAIYNYNKYT